MGVCYNCPFFSDARNGKVYCEAATIRTPDQQTYRDILYKYCAHPENYKECTLYKVLQRYYERKYNTEFSENTLTK